MEGIDKAVVEAIKQHAADRLFEEMISKSKRDAFAEFTAKIMEENDGQEQTVANMWRLFYHVEEMLMKAKPPADAEPEKTENITDSTMTEDASEADNPENITDSTMIEDASEADKPENIADSTMTEDASDVDKPENIADSTMIEDASEADKPENIADSTMTEDASDVDKTENITDSTMTEDVPHSAMVEPVEENESMSE